MLSLQLPVISLLAKLTPERNEFRRGVSPDTRPPNL